MSTLSRRCSRGGRCCLFIGAAGHLSFALLVESGKVIRALAGIAGRGRVVQEVGREEVEKGGKSSWEMGYGQHSSTQLTQHVLISTLDTVLKQNTETETTRTA